MKEINTFIAGFQSNPTSPRHPQSRPQSRLPTPHAGPKALVGLKHAEFTEFIEDQKHEYYAVYTLNSE